MQTSEPGTFLTAVDDLAGALQSEDKLDALLSRVEAQARKLVPDLSTEASRGIIRSNAYEVAKSKTAMEKAALALTEDWRSRTKAVNGMRAVAAARLEALKDEVRAPLTKWEAEEKARIERLEAALAAIASNPTLTATAAALAAEMARVEAIVVDESWQEYEDGARRIKADTLATLTDLLAEKERHETQIAELEALRAEKAARDAADRVEAEAKAAEERRIARERAEAERQAQAAREREEAAARAAEAARIAAELEAAEKIAAAEREAQEAERRRQEAEAAAEREREEAAAREAEAARKAAEAQERALEEQRLRLAEERRQQEEAERKRAENARLRTKARNRIVAALTDLTTHPGQTHAEAIADAIVAGGIPHVEFRP